MRSDAHPLEPAPENPSITYPHAWLWCDRDGRLGMGTHVPKGHLAILEAPWLRLRHAARAEAVPGEGGALVVPGMRQAGTNHGAALAAAREFRKQVIGYLDRLSPMPPSCEP